jgi:hypothetical protein
MRSVIFAALLGAGLAFVELAPASPAPVGGLGDLLATESMTVEVQVSPGYLKQCRCVRYEQHPYYGKRCARSYCCERTYWIPQVRCYHSKGQPPDIPL